MVREEFNFLIAICFVQREDEIAHLCRGDLEAVVGQLCLEILLLGGGVFVSGFYSFPKDKGILVLGVF